MGRGLKSLGTTALDENILKMFFEKRLRFRLKTLFREQFQNGGKFLFKTFLQKNNAELLYTLRELQTLIKLLSRTSKLKIFNRNSAGLR